MTEYSRGGIAGMLPPFTEHGASILDKAGGNAQLVHHGLTIHEIVKDEPPCPTNVTPCVPGRYFYTVNLHDCSSDLLVREIVSLRATVRAMKDQPFDITCSGAARTHALSVDVAGGWIL
jgi:hypothetical protein